MLGRMRWLIILSSVLAVGIAAAVASFVKADSLRSVQAGGMTE
jgi:uncharacterized protein involved in exopolysaccharide biosynthesis